MNSVILSGPALSVTKSDAKYLLLFNTDTLKPVCNVMFAPNVSKNIQMGLNDNLALPDTFTAVLNFIAAVSKQFNKAPVALHDTDALVFALSLNAGIVSAGLIGELIATMDFVVEASTITEGGVNKVRFAGMNIQGIKQLAAATDLTLTINQK
jgi:hypothetical protein